MTQSTEPPKPRPRPASLAVWMSSSVAVFVLLGSLSLVLAFERHLDREERQAFEGLARVNAGFLERTRLPQSEKMAAQLGEIIGARVFFWQPKTGLVVGKPNDSVDSAALRMACDGKVKVMPDGAWMVGVLGRDNTRVIFLRPTAQRVQAMDRADTWLALGVFWVLSLGLGWWLARRVTRPLRSLAESLPLVGTECELPVLPVSRGDEIGQLAQTLTRTHESLRNERERRRAAERHAMLGRMATSLAHEVRNPVAAIRLHAQLLEIATPDEAAISRGLIESEAERIEGLVSQWLSYAKPAPPVLAELNLLEALRQALRLIEPQARHAGVLLECKVAEGSPGLVIFADRHRVQQVLGNLLLNAVQAMPRGGQVSVGVEDGAERVAVVIDDEGSGFSASALARLGEPFYSEKEGGMGLGLAVVKDICEAHGGGLTVETRSRGGASVHAVFAKAPWESSNNTIPTHTFTS
ncbi:MAG: HAMP domain-containing sensor histidine kinase [Verrucomicrobiota bacterium]